MNLMRQARAEAIGFGHEYVGTEHLLLALASLRGSHAARVLAARGVTRSVLLTAVSRLTQPGLGEVPEDKLPCNPHAKRTIDRAVEEAR